MAYWSKVRPEIDEMVNRQFDTREFKRLFAVPLTPARVEVYQNHMTYYASNRRDCWAMVMGKAPLDVKRAIWEHEKDELIHDPRIGRAHVIEADLQAADESRLGAGARAAFYAWLCCAREKPLARGTGLFPYTRKAQQQCHRARRRSRRALETQAARRARSRSGGARFSNRGTRRRG